MTHVIPPMDLYAFINKFETDVLWKEFARIQLGLKNREINDIEGDYPAKREQKYQMLCLWQNKKGRRATLQVLNDLRKKFDEVDNEDSRNPVEVSRSASVSSMSHLMSGGNPQAEASTAPPSLQRPNAGNVNNATAFTESHQRGITNESNSQLNNNPQVEASTAPPRHQPAENRSHARTFTESPRQGATKQSKSVNPIMADNCNEVPFIEVINVTPQEIQSFRDRKDVYEIENNPKGYVLIINNQFKGKEGERIGSERDVENMKTLWEKLGCKVRVEMDLKAADIVSKLGKMSQSSIISDFDFVAIFIMSHGGLQNGNEYFSGDDEKPVHVKKILEMFDNERCPALIGKPKLFFFQFCRGRMIDTGTYADDHGDEGMDELFRSLHNHFSTLSMSDEEGHPVRSDLLISYSTQSGYKSFRDKTGSWFINAIAHIFMQHGHEDHVADLMTKVRKSVSDKIGQTYQGNNIVNCKEMSESRTLLLKKLYLLPGHRKVDPLDD